MVQLPKTLKHVCLHSFIINPLTTQEYLHIFNLIFFFDFRTYEFLRTLKQNEIITNLKHKNKVHLK